MYAGGDALSHISVNHQDGYVIYPTYKSDISDIANRPRKGRPVSNNRLVRVIIQDAQGRRIPEAMVSIQRAPVPPPDLTAVSGESGEAVMRIHSIGQYEFVCSAERFESATVTAMITDAPLSLVMIVLRPDI